MLQAPAAPQQASSPTAASSPKLEALHDIDQAIAEALAAWLHATAQTPPQLPLHEAAAHCVPLCQLFAQIAPQNLSTRDFFIPSKQTGPNAVRQNRYNTRRLARSLLDYFTQRNATTLTPAFSARLADLAEAPSADLSTAPAVLLTLAEGVLCAAVHSSTKESYINAVLTLPPHMQDTLAASIRRTAFSSSGDTRPDSNNCTRVLSERHNDENVPTMAPAHHSTAFPPKETPGTLISDPLSTPRGIPLAEYKALAEERDVLRKKLIAAENARSKQAEESDDLRSRLDDAGDTIRALERVRDETESDVAVKAKALSDSNAALREAHVAAEEIDMLRAQAASAKQLEASLKRASKRLEEVADMRRVNKDLEAQVTAFRENEERMSKHADYLEAQLKSSNDRAQQLASMSDDLSTSLEDREKEVSKLKSENIALKDKLKTADNQLASMLVQSSNTHNLDSQSQSIPSAESPSVGEEVAPVHVDITDSSTSRPQFQESVVTEHLFNEIGVQMSWEDIVECIRGVVDALKEMEEFDATQDSAGVPVHYGGEQSYDDTVTDHSGRLTSSQASSSTMRSQEGNNGVEGKETPCRKSVLPEFRELDSRLKAENRGIGDEFDFAANESNVQEIPVLHKTQHAGTNQTASDEESSYASGYSSENVNSAVDGIVNATEENQPEQNAQAHRDDGFVGRNDTPYLEAPGSCTKDSTGSVVEKSLLAPGSQVDINDAQRSSYNALQTNVRRAASLTVSVLRGLPRSPSHSARALVRQARSELSALQRAMEAMRAERENSASIGVLVQQLHDVREELSHARSVATKKEAENTELRRELNVLIKEFDAVTVQKQAVENREGVIVQEKERLLSHLQEALDVKDLEVKDLKMEVVSSRQHIRVLQDSEHELAEKLRAADVVSRAQEVELARVSAKVEANEMMATRLNAVVTKTDGLNTEMKQQRENHMQDIAAAARREKQLAEEARDEARRVAKSHARVLEDVRATAVAAAMARTEDRGIATRKSNRFGDFWRKLLHIDKVTIDYTMPPSTSTSPRREGSSARRVSRNA